MEDDILNQFPENNTNLGQNPPISPDISYKAPDLSTASVPAMQPTPIKNINDDFFSEEKAPQTTEPVRTMPSANKNNFFGEMEEKFEKGMGKNQKLTLIVVLGLIALILIGGGTYYFLAYNKKITVQIASNQPVADVTIDGVTTANVKMPYQITLAKGQHNIILSENGFAPAGKTVTISSPLSLSFDLVAYQSAAKVYDQEIFFPIYDKDLDTLSYFQKGEKGWDLKSYSYLTSQGSSLVKNIGDISKVVWSPSFRQVDIKVTNSASISDSPLAFQSKYGEGTKINWIVDLERKDLVNITTTPLAPEIKNISFNPEGNKIVYFFQNDTERSLAIANIDGSNFERIIQVKTLQFEPDVVWSPDGSKVAIFVNTENGTESIAGSVDIYIYDFTTRNLTQLTNDGISFGALFSPDGTKMLYQSGNGIWIYDFISSNAKGKDLNLATNLTNCAWIDNSYFITYSNQNQTAIKVNSDGSQEILNFQKDSLPTDAKQILASPNKALIISKSGIYTLSLQKGV